MSDSLTVRPAGVEPQQLAAYARLLGDVFAAPEKFSTEAVAWRYRDNPAGQVVGADAWDGDRLAAHYVTCPTEAVIDGQIVKGLLSLNTATHPDYQGRGLFTRLAEAAYAQGTAAGYKFVIGVANDNSTPGFLRKLAFQNVGPLQAGILASPPRKFSEAPLQYRAHWNRALLQWRLANPIGQYVAARRGDLVGVWARTHLPLVSCGAFLPGELAKGVELGAAPIGFTLFMGLEPRMALRSGGFLPIPKRLRPSPLNLIWRGLGDGPAALDPSAVSLNFLDFDPY